VTLALAPVLLGIARDAIAHELRTGRPYEIALDDLPPSAREIGATFVTLERDGNLLGCVGTLEAERPLAVDVARSARLAAFEDPRLPAVAWSDLVSMSIKISLLSPLEPRPAGSADSVLAWLAPGVDGVVVASGDARATFLPAVWATLPDPADFVGHLLAKAGLRTRPWPAELRAWRYTVDELCDADATPTAQA
jgi:AmmeMemoRadiSam system protein A